MQERTRRPGTGREEEEAEVPELTTEEDEEEKEEEDDLEEFDIADLIKENQELVKNYKQRGGQ